MFIKSVKERISIKDVMMRSDRIRWEGIVNKVKEKIVYNDVMR